MPIPEFEQRAVSVLEPLGVSKVFLPGRYPGLVVGERLRSYVMEGELDELLGNSSTLFNVDREYLHFIGESRDRLQADLILLEGKSGEIFREVFTHRGAGTLFSSDYKNLIRRAARRDVGDIYFLMKPYLAARSILPIEPSELTERIGEFFV